MSRFAKLLAAELEGIDARLIEVETDINTGLHNFTIVGLADKSLSEAKERVNAALKNTGVKPPNRDNHRITINLAPADVKKTGSQYDLAIALGYLSATDQMREFDGSRVLLAGELSLDGRLRPITGALNIARLALRLGLAEIIVPEANAVEAALVPGVAVIPAQTLAQVINHLEGKQFITPQPATTAGPVAHEPFAGIADIKGQAAAKRALMIAAAGGHNLLMVGPPGTGKTMLAQALTSILPPVNHDEIVEITQIYSAAGSLGHLPFIGHRPFRAPHQTASPVAVVGGGSNPRPGEISLAHRGVLFLDELPEFRRDLLESLRQPLESGMTVISRAKSNLTFPARFMLVAAMNPCPCGYYQDEEKACICSANDVLRYQKKVSGPLLDRIDLQITVPRISLEELSKKERAVAEQDRMRSQVLSARERQAKRHNGKVRTNSELSSKQVDELVELDPVAAAFVKQMFERSLVSARGYYRVLKTAQTIADLEASDRITKDHIAEAFSYRLRDEVNN